LAERLAGGQGRKAKRGLDATLFALGELGAEKLIEEAVGGEVLLDGFREHLESCSAACSQDVPAA
jgi:hypothetical protein